MTENIQKKVLIAPSLLAADFGRLNEEIQSVEVAGADWLHLDLMDGHFVPNLSFGVPVIRGLKTNLKMDCHLMVEHPENYLEELAKLGVYSVTVHFEACVHLNRVLTQIHELGMKAAVAINPSTPVLLLKEILPLVDMVLVMSVNPGFGGQKFLENALQKIRDLKQLREDLLVEVDGGINGEIARKCVAAGADVLVAGSYIFGAGDRKGVIEGMRKGE